jgi:XTP/dITP diphosphohydrolase
MIFKPNKILLGTHNPNKAAELQEKLTLVGLNEINFQTLSDFPGLPIAQETGDAIEENALQKAHFYFQHTQIPTLSDDTGLFIEALNGEPGVHSAYYAGLPANSQKNIQLVLNKMAEVSNRKAYFETVIAFVFFSENQIQEKIYRYKLEGNITLAPRGSNGFGYDSIFQPIHSEKTLAELTASEKNKISHRAKAIELFIKDLYATITKLA